MEPTAARRISSEAAGTFERLHQQVYVAHGFELVTVPAAEVSARAEMIDWFIRGWAHPGPA